MHACHVHEVWQRYATKVCGEKLLQLRVHWCGGRILSAGGCKQCCTEGERRGTTRGEGPGPTRALLFEVDAQGWVETPLMTPPIPRPSAHTIPSRVPANGEACLRYQCCSRSAAAVSCGRWSVAMSVGGAKRSDTLIRYRQRTLSKASGPPACCSDVSVASGQRCDWCLHSVSWEPKWLWH